MKRLVALTLVWAMLGQPLWAGCNVDRVDLRGDWGTASFRVAVADEPAERGQGLMNVPEMPLSQGMLFVFPRPQRATFWMKNTLIPLDMLFVSPQGVVLKIHENAIPLDETTIDGGEGVLAVLEINGGLSARMGITPGSALRHPALDGPDAAWPCEE
jgi:uncharacterized membrane protein (UPF0127 family)